MLEDSQPRGTISVIRLAKWQRLVAVTSGLTLSAIATVATFQNHDGVASAAMIIIGGLALILALLGVFPSRVKMGDYEFELFVDRMLEKLPEESREEVEPAVVEAAAEVGMPVSLGWVSTFRLKSGYEQSVFDALIPLTNYEFVTIPDAQKLRGLPDGLLKVGANGPYIAVCIKNYTSLHEDYIARFADFARRCTAAGKPTIPLMVLPGEPSPMTARRLEDHGVTWCAWRSSEDNEHLLDVLRRLARQDGGG